jgi:hypothetical protein
MMLGSYDNEAVACPAIMMEFHFKLTLDQLAKLKLVEAKISSRNHPPPDK